MSRKTNAELGAGDGANGMSSAARRGEYEPIAPALVEPGEELALVRELLGMVRALSDGQSDQLELIAVLIRALDGLTDGYATLHDSMLKAEQGATSPAPPPGDPRVGEASVEGDRAVADGQRALREQARQARHQAEKAQTRARSLAQNVADLQAGLANLVGAARRTAHSRPQ